MRALSFRLGGVTGFVVLFDEVLHHREDSTDINLLLRPKLGLCAWYVAFHGLRQWMGDSCDILRNKKFKYKNCYFYLKSHIKYNIWNVIYIGEFETNYLCIHHCFEHEHGVSLSIKSLLYHLNTSNSASVKYPELIFLNSYLALGKHEAPTLMTVSKVTLTFLLAVAVCEKEVCSRESVFSVLRLQQDISRGQVFLKILTIRIFTGNMMRELWTPIINCCQVNSKWPGNTENERDVKEIVLDEQMSKTTHWP